MKRFSAVVMLLLMIVGGTGESGVVFGRSAAGIDRESYLVSDGVHERVPEGYLMEPEFESSSSSGDSKCEETYGFMPCTTSGLGNLFLLGVYGYLMFLAGTLLSKGSEILLDFMGPGIIGGLVLPILGKFRDSALILVSGLSGSKQTAQEQVLIGVGLLAGSTVVLLTAVWGSCLIAGKCDLSDDSTAVDSQDTRKFNLFGSGITTDKSTSKASQIMVMSILPLVIVQIPQIIHSSSGQRTTVLAACITAFLCLLCYCLYQILDPWIQERRIAYTKSRYVIAALLRNVQYRFKELGKLLGKDGKPDLLVIERIFNKLDLDKDGFLSRGDLYGLLLGLDLQDRHATRKLALEKVMEEFDASGDEQLNFEEFKEGMCSWIQLVISPVNDSNNFSRKISTFYSKTREELDNLEYNDEEIIEVDNPRKVYLKAVLLMLGGAILAGIFADPLVDAIDNFSDATNIPSFFLSFVAMPLATNSSEGVSALFCASHKTKRTASLTYSEIYGAVTMNNTLCLGVFLAIVYIRGLDWNFSAEALAILIVIIVIGLLSSCRTNFPLWMGLIAFLLYLLTLVIVYVLYYLPR